MQLKFYIIITWYDYIIDVVSARAQKVAEWKDRKEAILRGEITATEETTDAGSDSIYDVQEEASGRHHLHHCLCY